MDRRPDGIVTQERLDDLRAKIKGHYVVPANSYKTESLNGEEVLVELPEEALRMIAQGWMCGAGDCLAMFTVPLVHCPACGAPTGPHHIVDMGPPEWAEHRKALDEAQPRDVLPKGPMNPDEWIARIHGNPEGDHTTISKLRKKRRPRR